MRELFRLLIQAWREDDLVHDISEDAYLTPHYEWRDSAGYAAKVDALWITANDAIDSACLVRLAHPAGFQVSCLVWDNQAVQGELAIRYEQLDPIQEGELLAWAQSIPEMWWNKEEAWA